jgi:hypothetical protein
MTDIIDADLINDIIDALGEMEKRVEDAEDKANGAGARSKLKRLRATVKGAAIELKKDQK